MKTITETVPKDAKKRKPDDLLTQLEESLKDIKAGRLIRVR